MMPSMMDSTTAVVMLMVLLVALLVGVLVAVRLLAARADRPTAATTPAEQPPRLDPPASGD